MKVNHRAKALKLARRLGIPYSTSKDPDDGFCWDGKELAVRGINTSDLCHEIAHWLVAAKTRRKVPDFGLGTAPLSRTRSDSLLLRPTANKEEAAASLLGILIEAKIGSDFEWTLSDHSWDYGRNSYGVAMRTLKKFSPLVKKLGLETFVPNVLTWILQHRN